MPRPGYAIRQARQHEASAARRCACGCRCDQHRELPYGSPGYVPAVFACEVCGPSRCPHFTTSAEAVVSALVNQWKDLEARANAHMDEYGVVGSHLPCAACGAPTCTYVTDMARQMRQLYEQMTEAECEQC